MFIQHRTSQTGVQLQLSAALNIRSHNVNVNDVWLLASRSRSSILNDAPNPSNTILDIFSAPRHVRHHQHGHLLALHTTSLKLIYNMEIIFHLIILLQQNIFLFHIHLNWMLLLECGEWWRWRLCGWPANCELLVPRLDKLSSRSQAPVVTCHRAPSHRQPPGNLFRSLVLILSVEASLQLHWLGVTIRFIFFLHT